LVVETIHFRAQSYVFMPQLIYPERLREELLRPKVFGDVVNLDTLKTR